MSVTFHQKLDQDSSESFQNTPQGDPAGWEAAVVTKNTKDDGVDLDNNGTVSVHPLDKQDT